METKRNFRSRVFKMAYEMVKATGKSFAVCLSRAWALYRLTKAMKEGIVTFTYEKVDGTLRRAKGTLKGVQAFVKGTAKESAENYKTMKYYDTEACGFRSFRVGNFVAAF
jgi:hypothetical protein